MIANLSDLDLRTFRLILRVRVYTHGFELKTRNFPFVLDCLPQIYGLIERSDTDEGENNIPIFRGIVDLNFSFEKLETFQNKL